MTLREVRDEIARRYGYKCWYDYDEFMTSRLMSSHHDEAAMVYARKCAKEALRNAASQKTVGPYIIDFSSSEKMSIMDENNIQIH